MNNGNFKVEKLKLKKLGNTRDMGGIPTADGKRIKSGMLIRSGKLYKLPASTKRRLSELGVKQVVDLRIDAECSDYPCDAPEGSRYIRLPVLCTHASLPRTRCMRKVMREEGKLIKREYGNAKEYIKAIYRKTVLHPDAQEQLAKFMRLVVEGDGGILFHCSAGRDRTGICAMLIETLLGVDRDFILYDFHMSYIFQRRKRRWQKLLLSVFPVPPSFRAVLIAPFKAEPAFLLAAIDAIEEHYGSVEGYCKRALGITDEDIRLLREKYLEEA